jgi:GT2 family glycosyltransferase
VIVPFAGSAARYAEVGRRLAELRTASGDELVVVDNRPAGGGAALPGVRTVHAAGRGSSEYARNAGAQYASAEWLVFLDADTRPVPDLLDRYFDPPPAARTAVLAGGVRDWAAANTLCTRYIAARRKMDQATTLSHPFRPYAQTANCAVRREAFVASGGFPGEVFMGGDADLCWRLQDAGWGIEERRAAAVDHENRARFRDLFRQLAFHGQGLAWLDARWPGAAPPPPARDRVGRVPHYLLAGARAGSREEAAYALADLAALWARDTGRRRSNIATAPR